MLPSHDSPAAAIHAAVEADRQRRTAILALPEAEGAYRPLAEHLHANSEMSVEEVRGCLAAARSTVTPAATEPDEPPDTDPEAYEARRLAGRLA